MSGLRAVAHPMMASIFIAEGLDALQHPERLAEAAAPVVGPIAKLVPAVPADPEAAVRLNGAVQVVAGTALGLGIMPRLSALVLAGTLVPATVAEHRYWTIEDPQERARQRMHFFKNVTILGGLLIAAADTDGRPSLAWRRKKASRSASRHLADLQDAFSSPVNSAIGGIAAAGTATADQMSSLADALSEAAEQASGHLAELRQALAESAGTVGDQLTDGTRAVTESVREATRAVPERVAAYAHATADRVPGAAHHIADSVRDASHAAAAQAGDAARYLGKASDSALAAGRHVARTA